MKIKPNNPKAYLSQRQRELINNINFMSHPIPTLEYEDNNGQEPDIKTIEEEQSPLDSELKEAGFKITSQGEYFKKLEAMKKMDLWACEKEIKKLPQQELQQFIENLVDFYGGKYGRLYY